MKQDCPAASQRAPRTASGPRDTIVNVLPPNLLFALAVTGMAIAEKGLGVTLGELRMLRDKLIGRLDVLGPREAVRTQ